MGALDDQAQRLDTAIAAIVALKPRVEAGAPWPMAELYGPEPEASWGPPELLAHVEEYLPYWLGEIETLLAGPAGAPTPFRRLATDPLPHGVIRPDRALTLRGRLSRIGVREPPRRATR